jgi:hypothetical protein
MQHCSKCGQTFDAESCPTCGNRVHVSAGVGWESDKSLNKYGVLLVAGFWGIMLASALYKPLDDHLFKIAAVVLFFAAGGIYFWLSVVCKQMSWHLLFVKRMLAFVVLAYVLYSVFVILNGVLDHSPMVQAETRVVRTYRGGRHDGGFYIVAIPSWRQGRNQEDFQVFGDFDGDLQTGDLIRVEVHRGALWLPWGPTVTDRMRCPSGVYGPSLC